MTDCLRRLRFSTRSLFLRLAIDNPPEESARFGLDHAPPSATFIDYYQYLAKLQKSLRAVVARKGTDVNSYTLPETWLAETLDKLTMTLESSRDNTLLRVIPSQWAGNDEWLAPWAVFHAYQGSPETRQ